MIIVGQDKGGIVNFNNLTQIYITQDEDKTAYYIRFETVDSLYDDLGEYQTEERAKEVLKEITRYFRMFRGLTYMNDSIKRGIAKEIERDGQDAYVYTMPED